MDKNLSKQVLGAVAKKTGRNISEGALRKIADGVTPAALQDEKQLRQLIKQVSAVSGVPVSESTIREIVVAVKKSGLNPGQLESMMKMMLKK
ncbi:MAG TPA: stage VI sporulation protein F [Paenibacillaceae bacterium]